jgi:hypothetical protein
VFKRADPVEEPLQECPGSLIFNDKLGNFRRQVFDRPGRHFPLKAFVSPATNRQLPNIA